MKRSTALPPSVCLEVEPIRSDIVAETFGLGWACQGFDFDYAEEICRTRKVLQVTFSNYPKESIEIKVDYEGANGFADFIRLCEDELMRDTPAFDSKAEERLAKIAVKELVAELERLDAEEARLPSLEKATNGDLAFTESSKKKGGSQ